MELPDLKGKRVAIVAMGASAGFYITARCNSMEYDEVWTINAHVHDGPAVSLPR
jgi:hypothetical protein